MTVLERPWLHPATDLTLSSNDVHVWCATLDQPITRVQQLAQTLSDDERVRAERFHFDQDRKRFIVGRGVLRTILSRYVGIEPGRLQFCYGSQGKPYLKEKSGGDALRFNLAHSHGMALYAFARGREIGIDLERVCAEVPGEQMAARFFSPLESATLRALPTKVKPKAFFTCWTRKEAYIKARGEGLSLPLDQFDVSIAPGEPAKLLNRRGDPLEASRWSLQELVPGPGYVGALVVQGLGWRLTCWKSEYTS